MGTVCLENLMASRSVNSNNTFFIQDGHAIAGWPEETREQIWLT